jgi:hypothetical protein
MTRLNSVCNECKENSSGVNSQLDKKFPAFYGSLMFTIKVCKTQQLDPSPRQMKKLIQLLATTGLSKNSPTSQLCLASCLDFLLNAVP